jgi:hypothetical protein
MTYKRSFRVLVAVAAASACSPAAATLYSAWDTDSVSTTVTTNNDLGPADAYGWRNILKFWFASDDTHAYFRMDLADGPGTNIGVILEPVLYAIYIDADGSTATGGTGSAWPYLYWDGSEVQGVDYIIDIHYTNLGTFEQEHVHSYTGSAPLGFDVGTYASQGIQDEIDGTAHRIEWSAPLAGFGLGGMDHGFTLYAATYNISTPTASYDLARLDIAAAPVPPSWLLVAPGLLLLRRLHRTTGKRG